MKRLARWIAKRFQVKTAAPMRFAEPVLENDVSEEELLALLNYPKAHPLRRGVEAMLNTAILYSMEQAMDYGKTNEEMRFYCGGARALFDFKLDMAVRCRQAAEAAELEKPAEKGIG